MDPPILNNCDGQSFLNKIAGKAPRCNVDKTTTQRLDVIWSRTTAKLPRAISATALRRWC